MEPGKRMCTSGDISTQSELSINDLDDDSLGIIFNKLPYRDRACIESVCKRWRDVSKLHWCTYSKRMTISREIAIFPVLFEHNSKRNENILEKILKRRGNYLQEISFSYNSSWYPIFKVGAIKRIVECCPNLKSLDTGLQILNADDWSACSNLEVLKFMYHSSKHCSELSELLRRNKRLRQLEICVDTCRASDFNYLESGQLEILHISCKDFELTAELADKLAESLVELNYKAYSKIPHNLQHLCRLKNLRCLKIEFNQIKVQLISDIVKNLKKLESLALYSFVDFACEQNNYISHLFDLPCLQSLVVIVKYHKIPYEELNKLFRKASNLKFFVLSSCVTCKYEKDNINLCCTDLFNQVKNNDNYKYNNYEPVIITAS